MSELRIVAGEWRGRRIGVPQGAVRPTADRVREAWMSIVQPHLDGARVVDLCAGSGALGLEALSRGAAHADLVERDAAVLRTLTENVAALGAESRVSLHKMEATAFVDSRRPDSAARHVTQHVTEGVTEAVTEGVTEAAAAASNAGDSSVAWDVAFADPPYREGIALALAERWLARPFATIFGVEHEATLQLPAVGPDRPEQAMDRRAYGDTAITFYRII